MGSRAISGGPNQHTSVVEEAWRGQEASKSLEGGRLGHGRKTKVYGEAGRGPEAPDSCMWKPGEARRPLELLESYVCDYTSMISMFGFQGFCGPDILERRFRTPGDRNVFGSSLRRRKAGKARRPQTRS